MLEKVWDKGEAYYKGYMLGVIIAEVESYRGTGWGRTLCRENKETKFV